MPTSPVTMLTVLRSVIVWHWRCCVNAWLWPLQVSLAFGSMALSHVAMLTSLSDCFEFIGGIEISVSIYLSIYGIRAVATNIVT